MFLRFRHENYNFNRQDGGDSVVRASTDEKFFEPFTTNLKYVQASTAPSLSEQVSAFPEGHWLAQTPAAMEASAAAAKTVVAAAAAAAASTTADNKKHRPKRISAKNPEGCKSFDNDDDQHDMDNDDDSNHDITDIGASPVLKTPRRTTGITFADSAAATAAGWTGKKRPTPPSTKAINDDDVDDGVEIVRCVDLDDDASTLTRRRRQKPAALDFSEDREKENEEDESLAKTQEFSQNPAK